MNKIMSDQTRFAVVFKTHFWDDFTARQFFRLYERAVGCDMFIIADETHCKFPEVTQARILRITEDIAAEEGYLAEPRGRVFWYNTDYQLYHFVDQFPEYDYIVTSEYDCVVNIDVSVIVELMKAHKLGFVGEHIRTPHAHWQWAYEARPYYQDDLNFVGRLLCFAVFSREFALQLQAARRAHTQRRLAAAAEDAIFSAWPNNEAFVGAEIARLGIRNATLAAFGDLSHYDWAPPFFESTLPKLGDFAFVHPVLPGVRFIKSFTKHGAKPSDLFLTGTRLQVTMEASPPDAVVSAFLDYFQQQRDYGALADLRAYALARGADERLLNIARGKCATQSSTCVWSHSESPGLDATNAVNGVPTGKYAFHTDSEDRPWWCVDLEGPMPVREIRVFNRMDQQFRARLLVVSVSLDMVSWDTVYRHSGDRDFGGQDGKPLKIAFSEGMAMRFVRIALLGTGILHLDQVEIYI